MPAEKLEACRRSGRCLFELVMGTVHAGYDCVVLYSREIENDCSLFARDSHVLSSFYSCWVDHGNYLSPVSRREDEKDPGQVGDNVHR